MTHEERATFILQELDRFPVPEYRFRIKALLLQQLRLAAEQERAACAETAWCMQMRDFGGGTAIGNRIAEGRHISRDRP